jgi:hypothetical protein
MTKGPLKTRKTRKLLSKQRKKLKATKVRKSLRLKRKMSQSKSRNYK